MTQTFVDSNKMRKLNIFLTFGKIYPLLNKYKTSIPHCMNFVGLMFIYFELIIFCLISVSYNRLIFCQSTNWLIDLSCQLQCVALSIRSVFFCFKQEAGSGKPWKKWKWGQRRHVWGRRGRRGRAGQQQDLNIFSGMMLWFWSKLYTSDLVKLTLTFVSLKLEWHCCSMCAPQLKLSNSLSPSRYI